jgi:iron(III) transport system ATP-binding protein
LWPHRTVFENVAYGLKLRGVSTTEIKARVEKTLSQIGLAHLAARYPHQLSGGQQQRVAIARALVYEPPVILLDEPLSNLDAKLREEARAWLRTLIVTLGLSAIHVTHDQVEAMAIADRIVLLDAGVIAQEGSPTTLYNEPATLFAAEFMGSNNRLDGKLLENSGGRATIELFGERLSGIARTKATAGEKATGIIRIERVRCASSPGANRLKMQLKAPMYLGERWELVLARENITVRAYASAPLEPGEHYVEFPPEALWVF